MRRAKNKRHLIDPQGIARRLRNRRGKTGKFKLKACSVILRDIFKFDTYACAKETVPSRSVTASVIDISAESDAKENIQTATSHDAIDMSTESDAKENSQKVTSNDAIDTSTESDAKENSQKVTSNDAIDTSTESDAKENSQKVTSNDAIDISAESDAKENSQKVTSNDAIDISTESDAKENIQKVTSNDVGTERTAELTVSLLDTGVCVPGNDANTDSSVVGKTAPDDTTEITLEYINEEETPEVTATLRDKGGSSRNDDRKEEHPSEM